MTIAILMVLIADTLFPLPLSAAPDGYSSYQFLPSADYAPSDIKALLKITADIQGLPQHRVEWIDPQGTTASCRPEGGGCTTHNEYSANGYLMASTWEFYIAGQGRPSGTYSAVVSYCTFLYGNTCVGSWAEWFRASFYIDDGSVTHTISGNAGVGFAALSYLDDTSKIAVANWAGDYSIRVPNEWSGTVTPSKPGYLFSPAGRTYTGVLADQTAQDYTSTAITSWTYVPLVIR